MAALGMTRRRGLALGSVAIAVGLLVISLVPAASASHIPTIYPNTRYNYYDATAGDRYYVGPFSGASYTLSTRLARAWINAYIWANYESWAWAGKTMIIGASGTYRFVLWGYYSGIVSAAGISSAEVWFNIRLIDRTTNQVLANHELAYCWVGGAWACNKSGNIQGAGFYVTVGSDRVNHLVNFQVFVKCKGFAVYATTICDANSSIIGNPLFRGIYYTSIQVGL